MVVKLARYGGKGRSFYHAWRYYCHDKKAQTTERVAAVSMVNLNATSSYGAMQEMTRTFQQAGQLKRKAGISPRGRKGKKPVLHWSLSWPPDEKVTHAQMIAAAKASIEAMGYKGHQALLVIHNDEPHPHIHIIVNRVHPVLGVMVDPAFGQYKLSRWAEAYERQQGKIRCRRRVVNNRKRDHGQVAKYCIPAIAKAWENSTNGKGFAVALKRSGYILARGDSRPFVVVDPYGDVHNPTRQIEGARVADIRAKLADLDPDNLPDVEDAKAQAAQWRQRQQAKAARRKARAQRYRRNWTERRKRISRPVPKSETSPQKPQGSPYRVEEKKAVPNYPKTIQAAVGISEAFYEGSARPESPGHDPPAMEKEAVSARTRAFVCKSLRRPRHNPSLALACPAPTP